MLARRSPLLRLARDDRLVAMIRGGQDGAFEVLFDRYQARLLSFCRHMLGSLQDAEDVLQEVFVAAYNAMLADSRQINVRPWLYRIARNRCLNHLRRPVADGQDSMDVHPHEGGATTHERVQTREDFRCLVADIGELPETQRTALLLREVDAMSYEEIAQAMDTTIPSVKSLLVRARIALAEASQARLLSCDEVRIQLAEAAAGVGKASGPARRHVRGCEGCKDFRTKLRSDTKALAALFPIGPVLALKVIAAKLGIAKASGAGATGAAGAAGSGSAISGAIGTGGTAGLGGTLSALLGTKAAAGVATAVLVAAGAVEVKRVTQPADPAPATAATHAVPQPAIAPPAATRSAERRVASNDAKPAPAQAEPAKPAAPAAKPTQPSTTHQAAAPAQPAEPPPSDTGSADSTGDGTSGTDPSIGTTVTTDPGTGGDPSGGTGGDPGDPGGSPPPAVTDSVPTTAP